MGPTTNVAHERDLLLKHKSVWLGFDALALSPEMSRALNVPEGKKGILVQRVAASSPAEALGLHGGSIRVIVAGREILLGGDIILEMLGYSLSSPEGVEAASRAFKALGKGDKLCVKVLRAGKTIELSGLVGG